MNNKKGSNISNYTERIETKVEVEAFLQNISYALDNKAQIEIQQYRSSDCKRDERFTNTYTISNLFPDENPVVALKRELRTLTVGEYIKTVKDLDFPYLKVYEKEK